jgi:hypothetical protein
MSLIDDVLAKAQQLAGPSRGYQVSRALPTFSDLQEEIDGLTKQIQDMQDPTKQPRTSVGGMSGFSTMPFFLDSLKKKLAAKQQVLDSLINPTDKSGVPPAPVGPAVLGPRIEPPKVGLNDLQIQLPAR